VGLKPGWESDYYGTPPSYEVGTLARIVNEERLGDGRYNLYVHSLARVRLRTLHTLTPYRTAEVEVLSAASAFRFSAGQAYRAIVDQRVKVLREERILERQLFSEFMMRRFDPAMRTCEAAEERLEHLSERAARAAELLGTRVSVAAAEQNRQLLESMNKRAALQMRLQETVEGLSVVAVSYYAVNLLSYFLSPLLKTWISDKTTLTGLLVLPVIAVVWLMVRRIKARVAVAFERH